MDFDNRGRDRKVVVQGLGEEAGNKALCSSASKETRNVIRNEEYDSKPAPSIH
jgi:hypothetical protein